MDGDGTINEGDLHVYTTGPKGAYEIPNAHANKKLIADLTNAIDILDPNTALTGTYRAPAGSTVISPLTHYLEVTGNVAGLGLKEQDIKTRDPFRDGTKDGTDKAIEVTARLVADIIKTTADPAALKTATESEIRSADKVPTAMALSRATRPLNEGPHKAIHLADVTFTDNDGLGTLEIALSSSGNDHNTYFEIRDTGDRLVKQLWLKSDAPIDYETAQIHVVTLTGSGSGSNRGTTQSINFTLNINNIHDEAPDLEIETNSANLRIGSTSQSQTTSTGLTFKLTDADGGEVKADGFKISSDDSLDQSGKFDIEAIDSSDTNLTDGKSYKIVAKPNQTFDDTPITLKVSYRDVGGQSDEITFATITPSDGPTRPVITSDASFNINEDDGNTISIDTLSADGGGSITWSITGGADRANFNLTSAGVLTFTGESDQEAGGAKSTHTVIVTASNTAGTSAPQTITVTIANIDEGDAAFYISGTPRAGQLLVARLTTADPDGVTNAGYSYQWYRSATDTASPDTDTKIGANNNRYRIVEADEGNYIYAVISYRDKSVTGQTTDTVVTSTPSAKIPITPVITTTDTTPAIDENDTAVPVGLDLENDTPVTWSVSDTTNFAIDANGALTFIGSSDQDVTSPTSSYAVTITATSTADNTLTDTADITLTINDINDETPQLTLGGNVGDLRISPTPTTQTHNTSLTFTLTDADGGTVDLDDFRITSTDSTNQSSKFQVVASNNNAIKDGRLYEIQAKSGQTFDNTPINLRVIYNDGVRDSNRITFAEFTPTAAITSPMILDTANLDGDNDPDTASYNIDENDAFDDQSNNNINMDILVATLSADGGDIEWRIIRTDDATGGTERDDFRIALATGQLYFTGVSNRDVTNPKATYTVIVTASNDAQTGATTDTQTITVTINNINDTAPKLTNPDTTTGTFTAGANTNRDTGLTFTLTDADNLAPNTRGWTISSSDTNDQSDKFTIVEDDASDTTTKDGKVYKITAKANQDIQPEDITLTVTYNDGKSGPEHTHSIAFATFTPTIPAALDGTANNGLATAAGQTFTGSPYNDDDLVSFAGSTAVTINLNTDAHSRGFAQGVTLTSIEHIIGSPQADTITGNADANIIRGLAGNDTLNGGEGDDIIEGGAGADTINGGAGNDTISYENAGSTDLHISLVNGGGAFGEANRDRYTSIEHVIGADGADTIEGNALDNILIGGDGVDLLQGFRGNDTLVGGEGDKDTLVGAQGNDVFVLGASDEGEDLVQDFSFGMHSGNASYNTALNDMDQIRIDVSDAILTTINDAADADKLTTFQDEANIYWKADRDLGENTLNNDTNINDMMIYRIIGAKDDNQNNEASGQNADIVVMVLEDFTTTLTIDMFDII